eukprot:scaffold3400_cov169-Amphora_coffeaeformis.AAC.16
MFQNAGVFHTDLSSWQTLRVTDLSYFLDGANEVDVDALPWDTKQLTDLSFAFRNTGRFDADLSTWDVSKVTTMEGTFHTAVSFTGRGLEQWQTNSLTSLAHTFQDTWNFNTDLVDWNTERVTDFRSTFASAATFNKDLSGWTMMAAVDLTETFHGAHLFNQNLCPWAADMQGRMVTFDRTFAETGCPSTDSPAVEGDLVTGSLCHLCGNRGGDDAGKDNLDGNKADEGGDDNDDASTTATTDHNDGTLPLHTDDDTLPLHDDDTVRPKFSSDNSSRTKLQIFEHDVDLVAIVIAFCSGGALVGWLVRRHMLRQRIYRRHMEVYAQVQPYDTEGVELTNNAVGFEEGDRPLFT